MKTTDEAQKQVPRDTSAATLYRTLQIAAACPLLLVYFFSNNKSDIGLDCQRWMELLDTRNNSKISNLLYLLAHYEEFRTLYYYRAWQGNLIGAAASLLLRFFYKPAECLYLRSLNIGPGFFLQHGYATSVGAYKIGKNCSVNQLVVIGWTDRSRGPILGDNVSVKAGAKILGPITIGDNVIVGANAVVTKDVPPNCVVAGIPARIIRRNGIRVDEPLKRSESSEFKNSKQLTCIDEQLYTQSPQMFGDIARSCERSGDGLQETEPAGKTL